MKNVLELRKDFSKIYCVGKMNTNGKYKVSTLTTKFNYLVPTIISVLTLLIINRTYQPIFYTHC